MTSRLLVAALLAAAAFVSSAEAGTPTGHGLAYRLYPQILVAGSLTPSERCIELQEQFDEAIKSQDEDAKAIEAKALREEAGSLCDIGKQDDGVAKLETALRQIGVRPRY